MTAPAVDYDYRDGLTLAVYPGPDVVRTVTVTTPAGDVAEYEVTREGGRVTASGPAEWAFTLRDVESGAEAASSEGRASL